MALQYRIIKKPDGSLGFSDETPIGVTVATPTSVGLVKPGEGMEVGPDGTLSLTGAADPIATRTKVGIVRPGMSLTLNTYGDIGVDTTGHGLKTDAAGRAAVDEEQLNGLVHTTQNESIDGTKTFAASPYAPTVSDYTDSTDKVATTKFVQNAIKEGSKDLDLGEL